jgi:hypothetical protein
MRPGSLSHRCARFPNFCPLLCAPRQVYACEGVVVSPTIIIKEVAP